MSRGRLRLPLIYRLTGLFAGHQDPFSPFETVKEYAAALPHIRLIYCPDYGQLLHPYVSKLFDVIEEHMQVERV